MDKFYDYILHDFLNDDSFIRFVKRTDQKDIQLWEDWLKTTPSNLAVYTEARATILVLLSIEPINDHKAEQDALWARIAGDIQRHDKKVAKVFRFQMITSVAATLLLVFSAGLWFYRSKVTITTLAGEHREALLPDGSRISLNANTTLSYYRAWSWHRGREVWMNGEAFFEVSHLNQDSGHIKAGDRFFVHADALNVEVLGTTFNIKHRRDKYLVSLLKGSIRVSGITSKGTFRILKPGEAVSYERQRLRPLAISGLQNRPLAWMDRRMEVRGMTVAGIIEDFEDTYSSKIVIDRPQLLQKHIDGTILLTSPENTVYMLANLLNSTVERQDNVYYLRSK